MLTIFSTLACSATFAVANPEEHCLPSGLPLTPPALEQCPMSPLSPGLWELEAVTDVAGYAEKNGYRAYGSTSMGGAVFNANLDPLDCNGEISIDLLESGRRLTLSAVDEGSDENGTDHARLVGTTVVQPALNMAGKVELRASDRETGMLVMSVDSVDFADAVNVGVVMRMGYAEDSDIHPYCDCRTQLREYLAREIAFYESILAGYEDTRFWLRPDGLHEDIEYDYGTYNQFQLMVSQRGLTTSQVVDCFNDQYEIMTEDERKSTYVRSFFGRLDRAGAVTDPSTCVYVEDGEAGNTCYPDIVNAFYSVHENVHVKDCVKVREPLNASARHKDVFDFIEATTDAHLVYPVQDPSNLQPQALAETESRAYRATIALLRGWEEDNCGG